MSASPPRVATFRAAYRERLPSWYNGWAHVLLNSAGAVLVGALCLSRLQDPGLADAATVPVVFLLANAVEHLAHRYPMHRPLPGLGAMFQRHVGVHHRYFRHDSMPGTDSQDFHATLTAPVQVAFLVLAGGLPLWLLVRTLLGPDAAALTGATSAVYYLVFEWLHLAWHAREDSWVLALPGMRALRQHHLLHHDPALMNQAGFNITFPITDHLLNTRPQD
mgnify:CR=1 FL=1